MQTLSLLPYFVVAAIAAFAVFNHCFDDNLLQRIGLSGICIGAVLQVVLLHQGCAASGQASLLLTYGLAFFGSGTVYKLKKAHNP